MIGTRFIASPEEATDGLAALDRAFWEQDTISPEDMDDLAGRVAASIGAVCTNDAQLLLYPLEGCEVKATIGQIRESPPQRVDVTPYVSTLRSALSERLANLLPNTNIVVVDHRISRHSARILSTTDGRILKAPMDWDKDRGFKDPEKRKRDRLTALQLLYSLPERSPFIAYNITHVENEVEPQTGRQLQRKLKMQTLYQHIYESPKQIPSPPKALTYLGHAMQGAAFLVDHGLRLTDICPLNIAIDQKTDCAFLFDMDTLATSTEPLEHYLSRPEFRPPERATTRSATGVTEEPAEPVREAEMVYEMGITLQEICRQYKLIQDEVLELVTAMTSSTPEDRPTIRQAIELLQKAQPTNSSNNVTAPSSNLNLLTNS